MDSFNETQFDPSVNHPSESGRLSGDNSLKKLSRRFTQFRGEHPLQTRIPDTLRKATLAALRRGVTQAQVRRACGVTSGQLDDWQQSLDRVATPARRNLKPARVFSVVDDNASRDSQATSPNRDQPLELRLGGWEICVRQVGASSRRG
jgi:hypothetical protein